MSENSTLHKLCQVLRNKRTNLTYEIPSLWNRMRFHSEPVRDGVERVNPYDFCWKRLKKRFSRMHMKVATIVLPLRLQTDIYKPEGIGSNGHRSTPCKFVHRPHGTTMGRVTLKWRIQWE